MADTPPSAASLPFRQIARLAHELHFNGIHNLNAISPRRYDRGVVFMLVARCCLADWSNDGLGPPAAPGVFTSVNALAASLGRPYETIRAHVRGLVEEGLCVSDSRGVALSTSAEAAPRIIGFFTATHDVFLRFCEDVSRWTDVPVRPGEGGNAVGKILKPALDAQLAPFEILRSSFSDWRAMMVWAVIAGGCVRHITIDPALSARYAEDVPPDTERRPVTLAVLEAVIGLPYSTLWRHVRQLAAEGRLVRRDKGWIVSARYLQTAALEQDARAAVAYDCSRLAEMARSGFDPKTAGAAYLRERPALAPLEAP